MKIEPLEHKHRYRFRVRAVNKIGRSEPCEMLGDDILIKDPWGESGLTSFCFILAKLCTIFGNIVPTETYHYQIITF